MNFKESLNKLRNMSDEEIISNIERATGKELVSYEGMDALIAALMGFYNGELNKKANASHNHNKADITDFNHTHDDRYYTETEVDNRIKGSVVDNLTTNDGTKALSARQGKILNENKSDKSEEWRIRVKTIGNISTPTDLNTIYERGFYISPSSSNKFLNIPNGQNAFELTVTGIGIDSSTTYKTQLLKEIGTNTYWVRTQTNWTTPVTWTSWTRIWNSGSFNPNTKLNTSGGTISGALTVTGNIVTNGILTANDVYLTSDKKEKTNLKVINNPLEKIKKINGYTFDWKKTNKKSSGVIAQEVEKILPSIVYDTEQGKKVNYNGIIALLVESNKELLKRIEVLESRVR